MRSGIIAVIAIIYHCVLGRRSDERSDVDQGTLSPKDSTLEGTSRRLYEQRVRLFCKRSRQVQDHSAYDKYEVQKTRALLLKFLSQNIADAIFSVRAKSM